MVACEQVIKWAVQSRVIVLCIQVLSHCIIPDHTPSMEDVSMKVHRHPPHPAVVEYTLGGLDNWDAEYFIFNAHRGYSVHEQTMAFFPLLPASMRTVGQTFLLPLSWCCSQRTVMLLAGVLVNFVAFPLAAAALYSLTEDLTRNNYFSGLVAFFFCINPASVFMTAVYSETLFSLFTFCALLTLTRNKMWLSAICIALATATRSNGIVLCGYLGYHCLECLWKIWVERTSILQRVMALVISRSCQVLLAAMPFAVFQYHGYRLYCNNQNQVPEWCKWNVPIPYSYIQEHYWNVGFLRYFELKQIPNFLLATPMIILSVLASWQYFWSGNSTVKDLVAISSVFRSVRMRPYMVHLMFLTVFGVLNMHVQVLTRFLCSSSPVVYWAAGLWMAQFLSAARVKPSLLDNTSVPAILRELWQRLQESSATSHTGLSKAVLIYFISYVLLGCLLHCNFYPWT